MSRTTVAARLILKERWHNRDAGSMNIHNRTPAALQRCRRSRSGLTVLELLVCLAVSTVLIGIVCPAIHTARESARRLQCTSQLKQVTTALHLYHETHGHLPAGWMAMRPPGQSARTAWATIDSADAPDEPGTAWGWAVDLLPFLEQQSLFAQVDRTDSLLDESNADVRQARPSILLCPSDSAAPVFDLYAGDEDDNAFVTQLAKPASGYEDRTEADPDAVLVSLPQSNYVGIFGVSDPDECAGREGEGAFLGNRTLCFRDLSRGLSQVALVGERTARRLPATWLGVDLRGEDAPSRLTGFAGQGPNRPDADECELDSRHSGCVNMAFADGHVRPVANDIDRTVYQSLARRSE